MKDHETYMGKYQEASGWVTKAQTSVAELRDSKIQDDVALQETLDALQVRDPLYIAAKIC